ncbi:EAL domain-containing protein [Sinorhizobium meliloti]|uniref:EAL domain-containing protein n=2 Tax=Rhizobium meliloti TaxID=382 RepID=UPI00268F3CC3|nr:EAL domain-containing protein [Sinorhizobium meliloti]
MLRAYSSKYRSRCCSTKVTITCISYRKSGRSAPKSRWMILELATPLSVVRAVAGIGRSLGITTTVEGVETQTQLAAVNAEGFDEAQGYLFARPLSAEQVFEVIQAGQIE